MNIKNRLSNVWNVYKDNLPTEINDRSFLYFTNECQKDILITGINPSWRGRIGIDKPEDHKLDFLHCLQHPKHDNYWSPLKKILISEKSDLNFTSTSAYLDIFYFRETKQTFLKNKILKSRNGIAFLVDQLVITQEIIENIIIPKIIIIKNKESAAYWGRYSEKGMIWMGYQFEFISTSMYGEIYRIVGLINSPERISKELKKTNLVGTIVLFSHHINQYTKRTNRPNAELINKLVDLYTHI
jgi:hypothetical protein